MKDRSVSGVCDIGVAIRVGVVAHIEVQMDELRRSAVQSTSPACHAHHRAASAERQYLARELHDAVGQRLFGLHLILSLAQMLVLSKPALALERLERGIIQVREIQDELQGIVAAQYSPVFREQRLEQALRMMLADIPEIVELQMHVYADREQDLPLEVTESVASNAAGSSKTPAGCGQRVFAMW